MEKRSIDIYDLDEPGREAAAAAEVRGSRTTLTRDGRPVAIILSWDEYLSLAETVAILSDRKLANDISESDAQIRRGEAVKAVKVDDVPESVTFARPAADAFGALAAEDLAEASAALREIGEHAIAGAPLHDPFLGLWSWRGDRIRIVYRIAPQGNAIGVVAVGALSGVSQ